MANRKVQRNHLLDQASNCMDAVLRDLGTAGFGLARALDPLRDADYLDLRDETLRLCELRGALRDQVEALRNEILKVKGK